MNSQQEPTPGDWGKWQWIVLGVGGILLAVAIALAAGSLARQPVGLSGEPVSAGSVLDPAPSSVPNPGPAVKRGPKSGSRRGGVTTQATKPDQPAAAPAAPVPSTADDYSSTSTEGSEGEGEEGGEDD